MFKFWFSFCTKKVSPSTFLGFSPMLSLVSDSDLVGPVGGINLWHLAGVFAR